MRNETSKAYKIICPKCKSIENAVVEFGLWMQFPAYVHMCQQCDYMITESEWVEHESPLSLENAKDE